MCFCGAFTLSADVDTVYAPKQLPPHRLDECPDPKGCLSDSISLLGLLGGSRPGMVTETHTRGSCVLMDVRRIT